MPERVPEIVAGLDMRGPNTGVLTGDQCGSCEALATRLSPDWISSLPAIPQHGDFFCGNLLLHRRSWYIVDWESFGLVDLPLYDVLTFCLSLLQAGGDKAESWLPSLAANIPG